jgi:hypothetical protein
MTAKSMASSGPMRSRPSGTNKGCQVDADVGENVASPESNPAQRFEALDGLVFGDFKRGDHVQAADRLKKMGRLVAENDLDEHHRLSFEMKSMNLAALAAVARSASHL